MIRSTTIFSLLLASAAGLTLASDTTATATLTSPWPSATSDDDDDGHHGGSQGDDDDDDGGGPQGGDDDDDGGCGNGGDDDDDDGGCNGGCPDTTPPTIVCPELAKIFCGAPTGPDALGFPLVTDDTDPAPRVTWHDSVNRDFCGANRFDSVITRTWRAEDRCGNVATCTQTIDVIKELATIDVEPGECPNVYDPSCWPLKITLVGTPDFRISQVLPGSIKLWLEDCDSGFVRPAFSCYGDRTAPHQQASECDCGVAGPDGRTDLNMNFSRWRLNQEFGLDDLPAGTQVRLVVSGLLCNGCKFIATDCLTIP
jgi:hypothetical protein